MTTTPDHRPGAPDDHPGAEHVSRVRGQIGAAAASTRDLLDLLTAGLAEDERHTRSGQPPATSHDRNERDDEAGDSHSRDGGGSR